MLFGTVDANGTIQLLANEAGTPTPKITLAYLTGTSYIFSGEAEDLYIYGGGVDAGAGNGPDLILEGGYVGVSGNGGDVLIRGGAPVSGDGGSVQILPTDGDGGGDGGFVYIRPGNGATQGYVLIDRPAGGTAPELRLSDDTGATISIKAPAAVTAWTFTLPDTDGNSGEFLQTNGSGVTTWASAAGGGGAQVFRSNLTEAGSDNFVINTGFGNGANEVVSITVRDNNNRMVDPDSVTFDATPDQVTINLASYRAANGGTLAAGFRVVAVG